MAFINQYGHKISFDCSDLIDELKADISEFGDFDVLVVTSMHEGVTIFKYYNFIDDTPGPGFELEPDEELAQMPASKLLTFYELQNEIL